MCTKLDKGGLDNLIKYSRNFFFLFIVVAGNFIIKRFGIFDKLSSLKISTESSFLIWHHGNRPKHLKHEEKNKL